MNHNPTILALDLGTKTGWAITVKALDNSGVEDFSTKRFEGGGMRYVRFYNWLDKTLDHWEGIDQIYFEEVRRHIGTDASHMYGGFMATLTGWCERRCIPYQGVPVKVIKKYITGTGNANKQMVVDSVNSRGYEARDYNEADALALLLYVRENKL
jgi:Holliday junction resolvasome RuvABC endonuclease subunit